MSQSREIITASPDLTRLHEDGFELSVKESHLLVSSVPHLTASRSIARGVLIFPLTMATDHVVGKPKDHTAYFAGDEPHYADGTPIGGIINNRDVKKLAEGIVARFYFSSKPQNADPDFYVKVRRYVDVLSAPVREIDPLATAQTRSVIESQDDKSPFVFPDSHSARAEITPITNKLKGMKIAIVGLGGTGSYILDFVAKTPVSEINLFDDDEFSLHNSYRAPGASTRDQLRKRSPKVEYWSEIYSRMHKHVVPHLERVNADNIHKLAGMHYVFLCMDPSPDKAKLVGFLVSKGIPFSDTGLGLTQANDRLLGIVNTITVTSKYNKHIEKIPLKAGGDDELYVSNIQIAELNALNAAMAVIRWKKHCDFYADDRSEHECSYTISPNMLTNEEIGA